VTRNPRESTVHVAGRIHAGGGFDDQRAKNLMQVRVHHAAAESQAEGIDHDGVD